MSQAADRVRLGLGANWQQFTLLVVINAFVGGMVGLERAVLPLLAEHDFLLTSRTAILSFIVTFGVTKALANLFAGRVSDRIGRKKILVAGWIVGLPVPVLIMLGPSWDWIIAANILLGINQGLCWSTTVIMKVDLVGPTRRGLAMGLNEFAGYVAVSLAALASGYIAATYALEVLAPRTARTRHFGALERPLIELLARARIIRRGLSPDRFSVSYGGAGSQLSLTLSDFSAP